MQAKLTALEAWVKNSGNIKKLIAWSTAGIIGFIFLFALLSQITYTSLPTPETEGIQQSSALSSIGLITSVLVKFGAVILLIYVSMLLIKRWQTSNMGISSKNLSVIETTHLSPRQALHLVRVNQKIYLIGATDQTISTLGELDETNTTQLLAETPTTPSFHGLNFSALLSKSLQRR